MAESKLCAPPPFQNFSNPFSPHSPATSPHLVFADFENAVKAKKYDIQDITIIEAVLKEESDTLKDSFASAFGGFLNRNGGEWDAEKSEKAVEIFLASLESLVNYYYGNTIAGQFS